MRGGCGHYWIEFNKPGGDRVLWCKNCGEARVQLWDMSSKEFVGYIPQYQKKHELQCKDLDSHEWHKLFLGMSWCKICGEMKTKTGNFRVPRYMFSPFVWKDITI